MKEMHEVAEGNFDAITQPTVFLSHTDKIKILELANVENNPPENHQDNGAMPPVNTQTYLTHSPPEYTLVTFAKPPPRPRVEAVNAALQAR